MHGKKNKKSRKPAMPKRGPRIGRLCSISAGSGKLFLAGRTACCMSGTCGKPRRCAYFQHINAEELHGPAHACKVVDCSL